jgi:hypothetical protein
VRSAPCVPLRFRLAPARVMESLLAGLAAEDNVAGLPGEVVAGRLRALERIDAIAAAGRAGGAAGRRGPADPPPAVPRRAGRSDAVAEILHREFDHTQRRS